MLAILGHCVILASTNQESEQIMKTDKTATILTADQFQKQVIDLVIETFGSLENFADAYNLQLQWEDEQAAIDMDAQ